MGCTSRRCYVQVVGGVYQLKSLVVSGSFKWCVEVLGGVWKS